MLAEGGERPDVKKQDQDEKGRGAGGHCWKRGRYVYKRGQGLEEYNFEGTKHEHQMASTVDLTKFIVTKKMGDQPHLRGQRVRVADIVEFQRDNDWTIADLVYAFTLTETEIRAALAFYKANREFIDGQIARENVAAP